MGEGSVPKGWRETLLLLLAVGLAVLVRLYPLLHGELLGPDSYYHAVVVRTSQETGVLSNANPLARCPWGVAEGAPRGMYLVPWLLSAAIPVKAALAATALIFAAASALALYLLVRRLSSAKTALIATLLFAVSFSSLQRSAALTFRGEHLAMPFFLLALYWALGLFRKEGSSWKDALLSGAMLGLTAFVWNGFIFIVAMYWTAVLFAICAMRLSFIFHKKPAGREAAPLLRTPPGGALLALTASWLLFSLSLVVAPQAGMGSAFLAKTPLIYGSLAVILAALALTWHAPWNLCLSPGKRMERLLSGRAFDWLCVGACIIIIVMAALLARLLSGGGGVAALPFGEGFFSTVSELRPLSFQDAYVAFGPLLVLFVIAVPVVARGPPRPGALFWGWLLGSALLMLFFRRFTFLASPALLALLALFAVSVVKSRRLLLICVAVAVLASGAHALQQSARFLIPMASPQFVETLSSLSSPSPLSPEDALSADACIVTMWDLGGMVQWHARLPTYTASVGGQDIDRIERTARFFLGRERFDQGDEPGESDPAYHFLVREDDIPRIAALAGLAGMNISGIIQLLSMESLTPADSNGSVYVIEGRFTVTLAEGRAEAVYIAPDTGAVLPLSFFVTTPEGAYQSFVEGAMGCLFIGQPTASGPTMYFFTPEFCESNLARMLTLRKVPGLRPLVADGGAVLYGPEGRGGDRRV